MALPDLDSPLLLFLMGSIAAVSVLCWAVRRLLTAGFIHGDLWHLVFNLLTLYFFSSRVLEVLGEARFLLLHFSAVVVAFIPSTLRHLGNQSYSSLGASGAVAAVMFSGILLHPEQRTLLFFAVEVPGYVFALGYLAYSAWHSYNESDDINHDAHFYGAAYGVLLTFLLEPRLAQRGLETILRAF
jgi:membrane associated rhomboid family serine protease